jgi:hypothetical protein
VIQTVIIAVPGLLALIVCIRRGPEHAFLDIFLPVLLLLPQQYFWPTSGQLSFADTCILPIAAFLLFRPKQRQKWGVIDLMVVGYVAITAVAEGMNNGYKLGTQNLALQELFSILLPYFVAKHMFRNPQFALNAGKRIVVSLVIVAVLSVYEFRMGMDLFTRFFDRIFSGIPLPGVIRGGFMRTAGPYGHPITLGIMMVFGFRLLRWLKWKGIWNDRLQHLQISKIRFCEVWIAVGSIMSLSVSPLLSAACGAALVSVCRAQNRKRAFVLLVISIGLASQTLYPAFKAYVSVDPAVARLSGDQWQEDAAYRNKLIPLYLPVVEERPSWGWGRGGVPRLEGMWSIDNDYLATALTSGVYALGLKVALYLLLPILLGIVSFPLSRRDPRALAAFTLIGIYALNAVMSCTASAGGVPWRLFFIFAGWSAALLNSETAEMALDPVWPLPTIQVGFRRVMV